MFGLLIVWPTFLLLYIKLVSLQNTAKSVSYVNRDKSFLSV